jgi:intein/homing endonuclease
MDIWDGLVCIAEGQLVITKRGDIPIQEVESEDEVFSYNEITKELEWKRVDNISSTERSNMIEIKTEAGNTLYLTDDHPVYTTNRGWVPAGQLTEEDELLES